MPTERFREVRDLIEARVKKMLRTFLKAHPTSAAVPTCLEQAKHQPTMLPLQR